MYARQHERQAMKDALEVRLWRVEPCTEPGACLLVFAHHLTAPPCLPFLWACPSVRLLSLSQAAAVAAARHRPLLLALAT